MDAPRLASYVTGSHDFFGVLGTSRRARQVPGARGRPIRPAWCEPVQVNAPPSPWSRRLLSPAPRRSSARSQRHRWGCACRRWFYDRGGVSIW